MTERFTQKKIKISSQGLFFNHKQIDKKIARIKDTKPNFFRPFNSVFERNQHSIGKQRTNFNHNAGLQSNQIADTQKTITAKGPVKSESLTNIHTRLNSSYPNKVVGLLDNEGGQVIAGQKALGKINQLQNNGAVKKIINGYISNNQLRSNVPSYKRKEFVPFVEERDHLGQLIDSEIRTELGSNSYVKKNLIKKPRKHNDKLEIRDDIPRRWLEAGANTEYQQSTGRVSIDGMPLTYSNYGGVRTSEQFGKTLYSPMNEAHGFNSDLDSNVQSFDKTKRNYKTLVAAAKNLKLPCEVDGGRSVQDNQTMLDTQASEKGYTAFRGKTAGNGPREVNSSSNQRPALLTKSSAVKPATADNNKRSPTRNRNLKQMTQSQPYGKQNELNTHFSQQTQAFSQSMGQTLDQKPEFISQSHGQQILLADEKASTQSLIDKNVSEILRDSTQLVNLKFNHLMVDHNNQTMKKLGLLSGTKHAIEAGITTQTETLLGGGAKTNPHLRLNNKEEEYVLSQLMQKNYDIRNSQAVFKSKTGRSKIDGNKQFMVPPVGLYEHKFNRGATHNTDCKKPQAQVTMTASEPPVNQQQAISEKAEIDLKYINKPHEKKAKTQAFSCFAETRQIDFTKSQTRDEVSFYKKLARIDKAKTLRMDVKEYEKLIRMQKSGRFVIKFNHEKQVQKNEKLKKGENEQTQTSQQSQVDSVL